MTELLRRVIAELEKLPDEPRSCCKRDIAFVDADRSAPAR
jgi:hypothetical protein